LELFEADQTAVRGDDELQRVYRRVAAKKSRAVAKTKALGDKERQKPAARRVLAAVCLGNPNRGCRQE
jgi:hypothetical protein